MSRTVVYFNGTVASGHANLRVTDGTAAGTSELPVNSADFSGLNPRVSPGLPFGVVGSEILCGGIEGSDDLNLCAGLGTAATTHGLSVSGAASSLIPGNKPFATLGSRPFSTASILHVNGSGGDLWQRRASLPGSSNEYFP